MLRKFLKENLIFLIVALVPYVSEPAIVYAQTGTMNPVLFTEPLSLSRGEIFPKFENSFYLTSEDYCKLVKSEWGWSDCSGIDAFLLQTTPETDTVIIEEANSDGHVKFDDWNSGERDKAISEIEVELRNFMKAQSKALGTEVKFLGWRAYPTLNQSSNILYYATDVSFGGDVSINVKASVFDRKGYITFVMVPKDNNLNASQIEDLILENTSLYKSRVSEKYASFSTGDKVAAAGAVGVLATLVGVKYGKAAATGFFVLLLAFAKKAVFLLVVPIFWFFGSIKRMFSSKKDADS